MKYQDIDRKVGEAYAIFDCSASKEDVGAEILFIRDLIGTPQKLELLLTEGVDWNSKLGKELQTLSSQSIKAGHERSTMLSEKTSFSILLVLGCKYFMRARLPDSTNNEAADRVADILNQAYMSPLYEEGERFFGRVIYEKNGKYVFRD